MWLRSAGSGFLDVLPVDRKLRYGMVGGGRGAFSGGVHRIAAALDGQAELVAGVFSSDPQRSYESGADLLLPPERLYGSYEDMAAAEAKLPLIQRLDFVTLVTPNHMHYGPAKRFLEAGFNVVCDKPVTLTLEEAQDLKNIVARTQKVFVLTYNYSGNAMVKQARAVVRNGDLGRICKVIVEYSKGSAFRALDATKRRAAWRNDPSRAGPTGSVGDIGTHCEHLARYITGLEIDALCADLTTYVPGRRLEDDASILLRFKGGAKGILQCTKIAIGDENNLNIRVYGDRGSLRWHQERPDELTVSFADEPPQVLKRGRDYLAAAAIKTTRVPAGHPEGYLEAFANLYREAFRAIAAEVTRQPPPDDLDFPTIEDGIHGMRFIEAVVRSSTREAQWVKV
jgi:predicted dehydrogenase